MSREKRGIKNKFLRRLGDTLVLASHSLMEQSKPSCACAGLWPPKKNWIELNKKWWCLVQTNRNKKKFPPFLWAKRSKPLKLEACSLRENTMHTNTPTASQSIRFQFSEEFGRHQHKRGIRVRTSGRKECADWKEIVALTAPKYRSQRIEPSSRKIVKKKGWIAKLALPDSLFLSGVCSLSVCLCALIDN